MSQRIDYQKESPELFKKFVEFNHAIEKSSIEQSLHDLVVIRVSQINGCAFCLDMHSKDARAAGETEQRLYLLNAWRESPFYSDRERAALAWTEALTTIAHTQDISDALYDEARAHFSDRELVDLTFAIIAINGWNRLAIPFRSEPGHYQPGDHGSES